MNFTNVPGTVIGSVVGTRPSQQPTASKPAPAIKPGMKPKEADMVRGLNYYADFSGCGYWRMIWPEQIVNAYQKAIIHGSTVMVSDEKYYTNVKCVRIQRQATPHQLNFVKYLKGLGEKMGFSLVYEIDDIVFYEDIPKYNKFRGAFADESIRKSTTEMMAMADEITVTCDYMKDYYMEKTGNSNITVIPNYPPQFWLDKYDENIIEKNYNKRNRKPRVLYPGSGAHFDVDNVVNQQDDFGHVVDVVRKTVNKYQWVFVGAFPGRIRDLVRSGKVEFHPWLPLYDYPKLIQKIKPNVMVAPLADNPFNCAKSDLKFIEGCALGIPSICQDMCTYENAFLKFKTGDEMIDQIDHVMSDKNVYMKHVRKGREVIKDRWLENPDNYGKYAELYTLPYGDPGRKLINSINGL